MGVRNLDQTTTEQFPWAVRWYLPGQSEGLQRERGVPSDRQSVQFSGMAVVAAIGLV